MNTFKKIQLALASIFTRKYIINPVYLALIVVVTGSAFGQFGAFKNIKNLIQKTSVDASAQLRNFQKEICLGTNPDIETQQTYGPGMRCEYTEFNSGKQCCNFYSDSYENNGDRRPEGSTDPLVDCTRIKVTPCDISNAVYLNPVNIDIDIPASSTSNIIKNITSASLLDGQTLNGATLYNDQYPPSPQVVTTNLGVLTFNSGNFEYTLKPSEFEAFKSSGSSFDLYTQKPAAGRCSEIFSSAKVYLRPATVNAFDDLFTEIYLMKTGGNVNNLNSTVDVLANDTPNNNNFIVDSISNVVFPSSSQGQSDPIITDNNKKIGLVLPFGYPGAGNNTLQTMNFQYKAKKDTAISNPANVILKFQCYKNNPDQPIDAEKLINAYEYNDESDIIQGLIAQQALMSQNIIDYGLGYKIKFPDAPTFNSNIGKKYFVPQELRGKIIEVSGESRGPDLCKILGRDNQNQVSSLTDKVVQLRNSIRKDIIDKLTIKDGEIAFAIKNLNETTPSDSYGAVIQALDQVNGNQNSLWGKIHTEFFANLANPNNSNTPKGFFNAIGQTGTYEKTTNLVNNGITNPLDTRVPCGAIIVFTKSTGNDIDSDIAIRTTTTGICGQGETKLWSNTDMQDLLFTYQPNQVIGIFIPKPE